MYGSGHPLLEVKTPRGNNERIYEAEAFFMPLNVLPPDTSLDSRMKYNQAAGFNHYNAHRTHISWPIKPRKYLKATQVGTSFTSLCAQCCLDADFFSPFFCLQTSNPVNDTLPPYRLFLKSITETKGRYKVTTLRMRVRARLKARFNL